MANHPHRVRLVTSMNLWYCNQCRRNGLSKTDRRYRCGVCADFDLCENCFRSNQHCHLLRQVSYDPNGSWFCDVCHVTDHNVRYRCPLCVDFDMCGDCFAAVSSAAGHPHPLRIVSSPTRWFCDCCGRTNLGMKDRRYRCGVCRDFDMCKSCFRHRTHTHSVKLVTYPWSCQRCHRKASRHENRYRCYHCDKFDLCATCFASMPPPLPPVLVATPPATPTPPISEAHIHPLELVGFSGAWYCDFCRQTPELYQTRHKCPICFDFNLCEACAQSQSLEHNHPLRPIRKSPGGWWCDVCRQVEAREQWRCSVCPDFDMCGSCYRRQQRQEPSPYVPRGTTTFSTLTQEGVMNTAGDTNASSVLESVMCGICLSEPGQICLTGIPQELSSEGSVDTQRNCDHVYCYYCAIRCLHIICDIGHFPALCPGCRSCSRDGLPSSGLVEPFRLLFLLRTVEEFSRPSRWGPGGAEAFLLRFNSQQLQHMYEAEIDCAFAGDVDIESTSVAGATCVCPCCSTLVPRRGTAAPTRCTNPSCAAPFCSHCGIIWHFGVTCSELLSQAQSRDEESIDLIQRTSKPCPGCGEGITHFRGHSCHHIKPGSGCPRCGCHFCYVCLQLWPCNNGCPMFCNETCGCPDCPECRPGNPCSQCDGRCPSCRT